LSISGSIGIGIYPGDGQDVETLMHAADMAMYHAKKKGRRNFKLMPNAAIASDHHCQEITPPESFQTNTARNSLKAVASAHWRPSTDLGFSSGVHLTEYFNFNLNKEYHND